MLAAALLALALSGAAPDPLAPLRTQLDALSRLREPTVENVRAALKTVRALESAARPLLARGVELEKVHQALAEGWGKVEALETALQIEGEGDGPERTAVRGMAESRARDAHALKLWESRPSHPVNAPEGLDACWQEHLLSMSKADALQVTATLSLEHGRVSAVEFAPALDGARARLGECLQTRLLGASGPSEADAVDLPLHFAPPPS